MNRLVVPLLAWLISIEAVLSCGSGKAIGAGDDQHDAPAENPVFVQLTGTGVAMPDGSYIKLPTPTLSDGMTAKEQTAALEKLAATKRYSLDDLIGKDNPRIVIATKATDAANGDIYRKTDVGFVAYGKWDVLLSEKFSSTIVGEKNKEKIKKNDKESQMVLKAGFLTKQEVKAHNLTLLDKPGVSEVFFYTTLRLFDEVNVRATRNAVLTKEPNSVIAGMYVDPRFAKDADYPNVWHERVRNAAAEIESGPAQPYSGAGFYLKATKLIEPADAIFVEYHGVYNEPHGWFNGENTLRSKLVPIIQHQVAKFRMKLTKESQ